VSLVRPRRSAWFWFVVDARSVARVSGSQTINELRDVRTRMTHCGMAICTSRTCDRRLGRVAGMQSSSGLSCDSINREHVADLTCFYITHPARHRRHPRHLADRPLAHRFRLVHHRLSTRAKDARHRFRRQVALASRHRCQYLGSLRIRDQRYRYVPVAKSGRTLDGGILTSSTCHLP